MEEFLEDMAEVLEEPSVAVDSNLKSFAAWDSLTVLSIVSLVSEKYKKTLTAKEINACETPRNLFALINNSGK